AAAARNDRSLAGGSRTAGARLMGRSDRPPSADRSVAAAGMSATPFDSVERVADAVLYEGYVLYPYRASAAKNQYRWQFGVVAPRAPHEDGEPWFAQTECLVAPAA